MHNDPRRWRGLYAIIDVEACGARSVVETAQAVLAGGCAVLQLRAKRVQAHELRTLALSLRELCSDAQVPFVLNDCVALAAELGADGVHLGQHDMAIARARQLAPSAAIGLSTHSRAEVQRAATLGADVIGFGPVFATSSKDNPDPVVGVAALAAIVAESTVPVIAIGGIDLTNIDQVAATKVPLVACIGALCKAVDPRAAAAALHARIGG